MNTHLPSQKKALLAFYMVFVTILGPGYVLAQPTGTCTVIQQPCNNDGILSVTITSGMTPPLTFTYYDQINTIIHSNVNSMTDMASGLSGCPYVKIDDITGLEIYLSSGLYPPLYFDWPVITNPICPGTTGSVLITINQGTMPVSVDWYHTPYPFGAYVGQGNPMSLPTGHYIAVATDANGCTSVAADSVGADNISIYQQTNMQITTSTTPASCTNGTASVANITGGLAPYTYQWSTGANTYSINNLLKGTYIVTVTDAQGCTAIYYANVTQSPQISVYCNITNATCLQSDGSAIAFGSGGTPPYTFLWNNGMTGQSISGIPGGTYLHVLVTDANGCFGNNSYTVGSSTPINVTYSTTASSCTAPTGSATLNITGGTLPYNIIWNSYPQQTGITLTNVSPGLYSFTVTDAVGCIRTGNVNIQSQSSIIASPIVNNPVCPAANGNIFINATGYALPLTYHWNNGSTTPDITNVPAGNYCCTITDNNGCQLVKCVGVVSINYINVGFTNNPATCIFANNGSSSAVATGGTAPYSYHWSNGQSGAIATGLTTGIYSVQVQDANGCSSYKQTHITYNISNDSCYCKIKGKVFTDLNSNCVYDATEQGISHVMMHCDGIGYTWTDVNGDYSFIVPTGSYNISENVLSMYPLATCQSNNVPVSAVANSGCTYTVDFANVINPLHDVHIITSNLGPAVPGYNYSQGIIIQNDGTLSEPAIQAGYRHDGQFQYTSSIPVAFTQADPITYPDWYGITSGFPQLSPGASMMLQVNYQVPANIPLNTDVWFYDTTAYMPPMSNWLADYSPWNNTNSFFLKTIGSFDPNFKEVYPRGNGPIGHITIKDSVLDYIIHFQNTGTYFARNIVIIDTLDDHLDWTSIKPGFSSHNYTASMSEGGVLKFTFNNINLPFTSYYGTESMGLVAYSVKLKPNLNIGSQIFNSAQIYFDYNAPVSTNTTINTIYIPESLNENETGSQLEIYPNPADDFINVKFDNTEESENLLQIFSVTGQIVYSKSLPSGLHTYHLNVGNFNKGFYVLKITAESGRVITGKFIR